MSKQTETDIQFMRDEVKKASEIRVILHNHPAGTVRVAKSEIMLLLLHINLDLYRVFMNKRRHPTALVFDFKERKA